MYEGKYSKEINASAKRYGVDPFLIAAVIQVESGFNPKAVSGAGAQGLMQLMPVHGLRNPFDPAENINAGTRFLSSLLKEFKTLDLALAGYNAGAGNVRKHGGIPPFKETQNYVIKVKAIYTGNGIIGDITETVKQDNILGGIFSNITGIISNPIFLLGVGALFLFRK
jgi:soluble lytic murein transglycosylase-like protein